MVIYDNYSERKRYRAGIFLKKNLAKKIFDRVLKNHNNQGLNVLEIGPGDGLMGDICETRNHLYTGIEENSKIAEFLSLKNFKIYNESVPPLPKLGCTYDICFLLHVIEHMNSLAESGDLLRDIASILKKNGKLVIATPDYNVWKSDFYHVDSTHRTPFTTSRLKSLLLRYDYVISTHRVWYGNYSGKLLTGPIKIMNWILVKILHSFSSPEKRGFWHRGLWTFLPVIFVIAEKRNPDTISKVR